MASNIRIKAWKKKSISTGNSLWETCFLPKIWPPSVPRFMVSQAPVLVLRETSTESFYWIQSDLCVQKGALTHLVPFVSFAFWWKESLERMWGKRFWVVTELWFHDWAGLLFGALSLIPQSPGIAAAAVAGGNLKRGTRIPTNLKRLGPL